MTTGRTGTDEYQQKSEMIDLLDVPDSTCVEVEDYPVFVDSAVGGLFSDGTPVFCGGLDVFEMIEISDCFTPGNVQPLASMLKPRSMAASVMWNHNGNEVLWITGGFGGHALLGELDDSIFLVSTEYVSIDPNVNSVSGPNMPVPLQKHCMIKVDESTVIFTGGEHGWTSWDESKPYIMLDTHFYTNKNGVHEWTIGPQLPAKKASHACGLIQDQSSCDHIAVVTGGDNFFTSTTTNLLPVSEPDSATVGPPWLTGPLLPQGVASASGITTQDGKEFLVVGGHPADWEIDWTSHTSIYSMSCYNLLCFWTTMEQQLATVRSGGVAILVPENYPC